jgi:hypothetical protein
MQVQVIAENVHHREIVAALITRAIRESGIMCAIVENENRGVVVAHLLANPLQLARGALAINDETKEAVSVVLREPTPAKTSKAPALAEAGETPYGWYGHRATNRQLFHKLLYAAFNIGPTVEPDDVTGRIVNSTAQMMADVLFAIGNDPAAAEGVFVAAKLFGEVFDQADPTGYMKGEIAKGLAGDRYEFDRRK